MEKEQLDKIRDFADRAHGDQMRKYSKERYIVHPERVMNICKEHTEKGAVLAAALLHDVLEDTEVSKDDIFNFLRNEMGHSSAGKAVYLVEELTDKYEKKNYPQWNRAKRKQLEAERMAKISSEAQTIKYADIIDNTQDIVKHDPGFGRKYLRECQTMLEKMTKGHNKLRYKALKVVEENRQKIDQ